MLFFPESCVGLSFLQSVISTILLHVGFFIIINTSITGIQMGQQHFSGKKVKGVLLKQLSKFWNLAIEDPRMYSTLIWKIIQFVMLTFLTIV